MELPNELLLGILQDLDKSDLKGARLVCKTWSCLSAEYLFNTIFISPHQLNLEVFKNISQHPLLCRCVKKLEYDGVYFSPKKTLSDYITNLWDILYTKLTLAEGIQDAQLLIHSDDPHINYFLALVQDQYIHHLPILEKVTESMYLDFDFIQEGYREYQALAALSEDWVDKPEFQKVFVSGLKRLERLNTVTLRDYWDLVDGDFFTCVDEPRRLKGSPLARSWSCFRITPEMWCYGSENCSHPNGNIAFWTLTYALGEAEKRVQHFASWSQIAPVAFETIPLRSIERLVERQQEVYSGLKTLRLNLASYRGDPSPYMYDDLNGLCKMLGCMPFLEHLSLELPEDTENDPEMWLPYTLLFPKDGQWPNLTLVNIQNMEISTRDLMELLIIKMPSLKYLMLDNIELLDGHWDGVLEILRISNCLAIFNLPVEGELTHCGGINYFPTTTFGDAYDKCVEAVVDYCSGWHDHPFMKHPSLRLDQPNADSLDFLDDVIRHCVAPNKDDIESGLAAQLRTYIKRYGREREVFLAHQVNGRQQRSCTDIRSIY